MSEITRGEFDLLKGMVERNASRTDDLDNHGTRGVGVIQSQLTDVIKDLAEVKAETKAELADTKSEVSTLRTEMEGRFDKHAKQHEDEVKARITARRWLIGIGIAGLASLAAVGGLLYDIMSHLHH